MSHANLLDRGKDVGSTHGHTYQGVYASDAARVHLGNTYYFGG